VPTNSALGLSGAIVEGGVPLERIEIRDTKDGVVHPS
jgi:hypothetical protein